ncbi:MULTISPECIES: TetR/AcrR family transcriptional regulator [Rhizobium]|uniref:TetR/AcrR family transcriptional regulator n=1 Tax=Rhizobium tropici TaxID=398 RepID=A0A329YKX7_RHITR|nr:MULTISPECIES: TetR/AcrR family transcriptional regulator [Rhizobium]MBB3290914.1 AcrR family transcriptional regulator [Rhizobium sp. BK252]MBB3405694.1 AcrR family transcriptional regulator [Rhizobium sp. BK289]MBB3418241.1 AcrR family transcriptional regulator [Rhizobium sp. BK284]MBB3486077.1 AcrR family transcriptional regulator [Rhizobium sp. BK347]MDK4723847.1 TetR/AcrR family transcriptional regulator [Rhizobium sp. CNPSo 3968]
MAGRPREFDRDEALAKARDLFWERGYEGVSMSDLVDAMGIASARIYAAFESKEALFQEAVTLYASGEGGFATRALAEEPNVFDAFKRLLRDAVSLYTRPNQPHGCMIVMAATNYTIHNQAVRRRLGTYRRDRAASLHERLKKASENGELKPDADPRALAEFYAAFLHGLSVQAADGVPRDVLLSTLSHALMPLKSAISVKADNV